MLPGFDAKPLKRESRRQAERAQVTLPPGVYFPYGGATAPAGYLLCTGGAVSRQVYAALFAVIGTTYGVGDGSTTFNVPDFRDRMPIGAGNLYANAATGGSKDAVVVAHTHSTTGTTSSDGAHTHTVLRNGTPTPGADPTGIAVESFDGNNNAPVTTTSSGAHTHTTTGTAASTGVSGTDANLPPYIACNYIIKT
jgi:microcystin-dependent protein